MTAAEHVIENAIYGLKRDGADAYDGIKKDPNLEHTRMTAEEAWQIAQHIVFSLYDGKFPE